MGLMTADGAELPLLIAWLLTERLPKPAWLLPPSDLLVREACGRASPGCGGTLAGEAGPVAEAGLGDQVPAPWSLPRGAAVASFPEDRRDSSSPARQVLPTRLLLSPMRCCEPCVLLSLSCKEENKPKEVK